MEGREEKRQGDTRIPAALSPRQQVQRCAILPQAGSSTEEILRSLGEQLPGSRGKLPSGGWLAYVLGEGKLRTHICVSRNVVILHSVSKSLSPASSEAGEKNPLISASHFFFPTIMPHLGPLTTFWTRIIPVDAKQNVKRVKSHWAECGTNEPMVVRKRAISLSPTTPSPFEAAGAASPLLLLIVCHCSSPWVIRNGMWPV